MVHSCRSILVNVAGVRQGSVLVPSLFVLQNTDFFSIMKNNLIGYADDFNLLSVEPSPGVSVAIAESLNSDLDEVSGWCDLGGIKLNASKTMIVSRSCTI